MKTPSQDPSSGKDKAGTKFSVFFRMLYGVAVFASLLLLLLSTLSMVLELLETSLGEDFSEKSFYGLLFLATAGAGAATFYALRRLPSLSKQAAYWWFGASITSLCAMIGISFWFLSTIRVKVGNVNSQRPSETPWREKPGDMDSQAPSATPLPSLPEDSFPKFPWPPPKASASMIIPASFLTIPGEGLNTLGTADKRLRYAMFSAGYADLSYYDIPMGFALVARIERFENDGTPARGNERWQVDVPPMTKFDLRTYLSALFQARTGYFRVIVFLVTPVGFSENNVIIHQDEAMAWVYSGLNKLPTSIQAIPYSTDTVCTALIYEFEARNGNVSLEVPGDLTAKTHLESAGIFHLSTP